MKKQRIMFTDLNCPTCAKKLDDAAKKLPGMKEANVSFATGTLTVAYDEAKLSEDQIKDLAGRLGLHIGTVLPA